MMTNDDDDATTKRASEISFSPAFHTRWLSIFSKILTFFHFQALCHVFVYTGNFEIEKSREGTFVTRKIAKNIKFQVVDLDVFFEPQVFGR